MIQTTPGLTLTTKDLDVIISALDLVIWYGDANDLKHVKVRRKEQVREIRGVLQAMRRARVVAPKTKRVVLELVATTPVEKP